MKKGLELELHVWQEVISLLKYDYEHTDNYQDKEELTVKIIDASKKIKSLKAQIREEKQQQLASLEKGLYQEKVS
ncbi:hypothetical protein BX659_10159 [Orenia metallireducens]|uniref:Uncharacterized protein n=1 Tax=Orenia metallireducens TaxID=1413210 RepID=A0A285FXJ6_9FIRM|nr:hypothetical protein [Orenia metallireducens]PRX35568.1 hypothetical protein BX659_10159 [Orenia metallireducens]SNY15997.1 hypothetical protein SAMN06265827_103132 [Orenia metallireducens]